MSRLQVAAGMAVLALSVGACGTTVPQQGRATGVVGSPAQDGLSAAGSAGAGAGTAGADGVGPAGGAAGDSGRTAGGGGQAAGAPGATGGPAGNGTAAGGPTTTAAVTARGLTATEIRIGVVTEQDAANLGKSLGAESLVGGDHVAEVDALVKHLNAQGGIAGRKVVPVYQDVKTSDATSDPESAAQGACSGLTEDKRVFAVISIVGAVNNAVMYQCMAKHGTPFFGVDLAPHHAASFTKHAPYVYGAHTLVLERMLPALVTRLQAQSWFTGWDTAAGGPGPAPAKVGVLYVDKDPGYLQLATRSLAQAGHRVDSSFGYRDDLSSLSSDMQSAVLQFRSQGITHLLIEESDGVLFFLPAAENQNYRPRYGMSSLNAAKALSDTGTVPERQFVGMRGIGWAPAIDVGNQKTEVSSAAAACRKVMKDAGQDPSDATAFFYMAVECDAFLLLKGGLGRQQSFTPQGLRQGLEALGSGFVAAAVQGIAWRPGSYDGVSALQDFGFDNGRFSYRGAPRAT